MKHIKSFITFGLALLLVGANTSCQDETQPYSSTATADQVSKSTSAMESMVREMPAMFNDYYSSGSHYYFAYGSMIHIRDVMTGDMAIESSNYDWFTSWERAIYLGQDYTRAWYVWYYYYKFINTANNVIAAIDPETASDVQLGYLGAAYCFRALCYLDMAQMYEWLPNATTDSINSDGNNIAGLTVPIVKENMSEDSARNNPRATHAEMAAFIKNDIDKAIEYIPNLTLTDKTLPHLDCAYGLQARYYLWQKDYANAQTAARNAINASSVTPMSEDDCLNTTSGFNDISKWMWGSQQTSEDDLVQTGIINWTSWCSNETTFGYAGAGPYVKIDASMYDRISNTDFRKKEWKAPEGSTLDGETEWLEDGDGNSFGDLLPEYASAKFRPNSGNTTTYSVGAASAFPIMRIEEMYFIEAEAAAHQDADEGKELLTSFMTTYRDPNYVCNVSSSDDVVEEIVFQKRVELWGEGQTFFDIKRLNYSVTRGYSGTNFYSLCRYNTEGRPGWMNFVITRNEYQNNSALDGYNNPDFSGLFTPWSE